MKKTLLLAAAFALSSGIARAELTSDQLIADYQAQGYTRIEVKTGPTQIKVEAIKGTTKLEVIYDIATGAVLKSESEAVRPRDNDRPGVETRTIGRDFLRSRDDDDRDDDDRDDDDSNDDDSNDDSDDDSNDDDSDDSDDDSDDDSGDDSGDDSDDDSGDDDDR